MSQGESMWEDRVWGGQREYWRGVEDVRVMNEGVRAIKGSVRDIWGSFMMEGEGKIFVDFGLG